MTREELLKRISVDPNVCFGKPVARGTRIWVSLILDFLSSADSIEEIIREYPHLTREDILARIAYGAEVTRDRFVPIPMEPTALPGFWSNKCRKVPDCRLRDETRGGSPGP